MTERTRSYSWADPAQTRATNGAMTGLEMMTRAASQEGGVAPIAATIGMTAVSAKEGEVQFAVTPQEFHYNPLGTMHGGVYATILDSALGCAVHTRLGKGQGYTSLTLEVKFLRAATVESGRLIATGRVVTLGRSVATAEAELRDEKGKLYATATSTLMIFPPPRPEGDA